MLSVNLQSAEFISSISSLLVIKGEARLQYFRNRYARNSAKMKAQVLEHAKTHREEKKAYAKKYRVDHRAELKLSEKNRRTQKNLRARERYEKDSSKIITKEANRRFLKMGAPGFCTAEQLKARFEFYGNKCAYCCGPAEAADHVIALVRGGSNWPANIRPACKSCNSSKRDKKLSEWKSAVAV